MKTQFLIFFIVFMNFSCKINLIQAQESSQVTIDSISYGKIHLSKYQIKELSKATNLEVNHFSSSIYYNYKSIRYAVPIDDSLFNHGYFNNYIYESNKKAVLHLKTYKNKNEQYLVAVKIEEIK